MVLAGARGRGQLLARYILKAKDSRGTSRSPRGEEAPPSGWRKALPGGSRRASVGSVWAAPWMTVLRLEGEDEEAGLSGPGGASGRSPA